METAWICSLVRLSYSSSEEVKLVVSVDESTEMESSLVESWMLVCRSGGEVWGRGSRLSGVALTLGCLRANAACFACRILCLAYVASFVRSILLVKRVEEWVILLDDC